MKIRDYEYTRNEDITEMDIYEGTIEIGAYAFEGCSNLTRVWIPSSVEVIKEGAFKNCKELREIVIMPGNLSALPKYFACGCSKLSYISLPENILEIGDSAFDKCSSLADFNFPTKLEKIGEGAFFDCRNLTILPYLENLKEIGIGAFTMCSALSEINLPKLVTRIEYGTFFRCQALTKINFSDGLTTIQGSAFQGCVNLPKVIFPSSLLSLGANAFMECMDLRKVHIPLTLKYIAHNAFDGIKSFEGGNLQALVNENFDTLITHFEKVSKVLEGTYSYDCNIEDFKKCITENKARLLPIAMDNNYILKLMIRFEVLPFENCHKLLEENVPLEVKSSILEYLQKEKKGDFDEFALD